MEKATMENKKAMLSRPLIFIFSLCLIVFTAYLFTGTAQAASVVFDVTGYAWSNNIGWIKFKGVAENGSNYGVTIDSNGNDSNGKFSGYAWSENIGWISFNPSDVSGCGDGSQAAIDLSSGNNGKYNVSGWARALNYSSGWDGCISLKGTASDGSSYGVVFDAPSGEFEGYAWGSDVVGWISFNCSNEDKCSQSDYKVKSNFIIPPTNLSSSYDCPCTESRIPRLSWQTILYNGSTNYNYEVRIESTPSIDETATSTGESWAPSCNGCCKAGDYSNVDWNTTYNWEVRVKRTSDSVWSDWSSAGSFKTNEHCYPHPNFTWTPQSPSEGEYVHFYSTSSSCYSASSPDVNVGCTTSTEDFLWTFPSTAEYASGSSQDSPNPVVKFTDKGDMSVSLKITDKDTNYSCSTSTSLGINQKLPTWQEQKP